eukprot:4987262-Pleurochrysis_carterae.AAC.2
MHTAPARPFSTGAAIAACKRAPLRRMLRPAVPGALPFVTRALLSRGVAAKAAFSDSPRPSLLPLSSPELLAF